MATMERTLNDWMTEAAAELGIDPGADLKELLDLARVVAHGVERPAAPLTTFLVGYAAAARGGGPGALTEAVQQVTALAERWAAESAAQPTDSQPTDSQSTDGQPTDNQHTGGQPAAGPGPQAGPGQRP